MSFQPGAVLNTQSFGNRAENLEIPWFDNKDPTIMDTNYPIGKFWVNIGNSLWYLSSKSSSNATLTANWVLLAHAAGSILQVTTDSGVAIPLLGNLNLFGSGGLTFSASGDTINLVNGNKAVFTSTATSNSYTFVWTAPNQARMYDVQIGVSSSGMAGVGSYAIYNLYMNVTSLFNFPATVDVIPMTIVSTHAVANLYTISITPTALGNNQISFTVTNANGFVITITSVEIGSYDVS